MSAKARILALMLFGAAAPACQTPEPQSVKEEAPVDELSSVLNLADEAFDGRLYPEAIERYKAIYSAASSRRAIPLMTEAAAQVATVEALENHRSESDLWLSRAEEGANPGDVGAWSRILLARGVRSWKTGDMVSARATFIELYGFCNLNSRTPRAIQAANLVALVSRGQEQLDWTLRAIEAAKSTGNPKWEAPLWSSYAWLLDERGRFEEALDAYGKARSLTARADVTRLGRLQTEWAYGHGLRKIGRLTEARDLLEQTNAIAHSIYISKPSPRAAEYLGRVLWEIGEIDATQGFKERARERFEAAKDKLLEAGATAGAPKLVRELNQRIKDLDAPPSLRKIPPRAKPKKGKAKNAAAARGGRAQLSDAAARAEGARAAQTARAVEANAPKGQPTPDQKKKAAAAKAKRQADARRKAAQDKKRRENQAKAKAAREAKAKGDQGAKPAQKPAQKPADAPGDSGSTQG